MKSHKLHKLPVIVLFLCFYSHLPAQSPGRLLESVSSDLNGDGKPDSIFLYRSVEYDQSGEPGSFETIEIKLADGKHKTLTARDTWHKVDMTFRKNNPISCASDYLFIHSGKEETYLLLFGFPYGSGRDEFTIIRITGDKIDPVFDAKLDDPLLLKDFDGDGNAELLGRNSYELYIERNDIDADIGTYSPFYIFRLDNPVICDWELTTAYNREHYIWIGPRYDENIEIVYPRDGSKPYLREE